MKKRVTSPVLTHITADPTHQNGRVIIIAAPSAKSGIPTAATAAGTTAAAAATTASSGAARGCGPGIR